MKGARSQLRKDNISDAGKLLTKLTISRTFFPLVRPLWLAKKGPSVGFDDKSLAFFIIILLRSLFPKKRAKYEKRKNKNKDKNKNPYHQSGNVSKKNVYEKTEPYSSSAKENCKFPLES